MNGLVMCVGLVQSIASMTQGISMRNQRSVLLNLLDDGGKAALMMRACCQLFDNSSFAFGAFARTGGGNLACLHKLANISTTRQRILKRMLIVREDLRLEKSIATLELLVFRLDDFHPIDNF